MDWGAISTIGTSITAARDIAMAMVGLRDQSLISEKIAALNDALLKAQEQLLAHNATLLQLQDENFKAREELRELRESTSERGRYTLVEIAPGQFAQRMKVAPQEGGPTEPGHAEPDHYICQRCFDGGVKVVLQRQHFANGLSALCCNACGLRIDVKGKRRDLRVALSPGLGRSRDR